MEPTLHDQDFYDSATPTIEVRIFQDNTLLACELCEDEQEAAQLIASWAEHDVTFLVENIGTTHAPEDILSMEIPEQWAPTDGGDALADYLLTEDE